jgi:hypothetical protein
MKPLINFIKKQRQAYKFIPGLHIHPRPFSEWTLGKFLRSVPRSLILRKKTEKLKLKRKSADVQRFFFCLQRVPGCLCLPGAVARFAAAAASDGIIMV